MSRSSGFVSAVAALMAIAATFLVVYVPVSSLWFGALGV
jgi:hypothetical protein